MRAHRFLIAVAAGLVLLAACGDDDNSGGTTSGAEDTAADDTTSGDGLYGGGDDSEEPDDTATDELNVGVATDPSLGDILVTRDGLTLYAFTPDDAGFEPTCTGACVETWPPYLDDGDASPHPFGRTNFGVAEHPDMADPQVTFLGWPLYTYAADEAPGDTTGQGVGGQWFVMGEEGPVGLDE